MGPTRYRRVGREVVTALSTVVQVCFDYAFSLVFDNECVLRVETRFRLLGAHGSEEFDQVNLSRSTESLRSLFLATVEAVEIEVNGELRLRFSGQRVLVVEPDEQFEAWSVVEKTGAQMVCLPGGGVSSFGPRCE